MVKNFDLLKKCCIFAVNIINKIKMKKDLSKLKIDKQNNDVCFSEETHTYFNIKEPELDYISVTTIIGDYHEKFDEDFWNSYKSMERIVGVETFKSMPIRGMLLNIKKWDDKYLELIDIDKDIFFIEKQNIKDEYELKRNIACERGTAYHLKRENEWYVNKKVKATEYTGSDIYYDCERHNWNLSRENAILPEYLVYYNSPDGLLAIAGQIDVLVKEGNKLTILDFKSNEKGVEDKAFFDRKNKRTKRMYYPINNLDDHTKNHYALQLSFYAVMLKLMNPEFTIDKLVLLHNSGKGETQIEVPFYEEEVKKIMRDMYNNNKLKREKKILSQIK